jgi:hypothetical protein
MKQYLLSVIQPDGDVPEPFTGDAVVCAEKGGYRTFGTSRGGMTATR